MELIFGAAWIDPGMGDRPFILGRVKNSNGEPHLVKFLIDTGSDSTSIPKEILDNIMKLVPGQEIKVKRQHQTFITTNAASVEKRVVPAIVIGLMDTMIFVLLWVVLLSKFEVVA